MSDTTDDEPTIRDLIANLTEAASLLPDGLDTPLQFGVCDGEDLRMLDRIDVGFYSDQGDSGELFGLVESGAEAQVVVMRGHDHPGDPTTRVRRGITPTGGQRVATWYQPPSHRGDPHAQDPT